MRLHLSLFSIYQICFYSILHNTRQLDQAMDQIGRPAQFSYQLDLFAKTIRHEMLHNYIQNQIETAYNSPDKTAASTIK